MKRTVLEMLRQASEKYAKTPYTYEKDESGWICRKLSDKEWDRKKR